MIKRKRVYICDVCGAMAPEETVFYPYDIHKEPPEGWDKLGRMDVCPECAKAVKMLKTIVATMSKCDIR